MGHDFMTLRQMQEELKQTKEDLEEAQEDLEACQCCLTCYYNLFTPQPEQCRKCRFDNSKTKKSMWRWRRDRRNRHE